MEFHPNNDIMKDLFKKNQNYGGKGHLEVHVYL